VTRTTGKECQHFIYSQPWLAGREVLNLVSWKAAHSEDSQYKIFMKNMENVGIIVFK
jgi:hypothetical protein